MATVPQRVSSQTEKDSLCVRPIATPVRPYAKEGWDSVSSRVTGPRHLTQWFGRTRGGVLVLDDLMEEGGQDKRVLDLFTKDSHHRNITVLYLTQDLFPPGKFSKTINRNAHYIVAFKNPRDQTGIRTILLQAFPDRWRQVLRLFKPITSRPFGYLMLDVHPASHDRYRLWSHLTPREGKAQVHTLPVDVPAVLKRAATRTRTSTPAKRRRTTH